MPDQGRLAAVSSELQGQWYPKHAIEPLALDDFEMLINVLNDPENWRVVGIGPR